MLHLARSWWEAASGPESLERGESARIAAAGIASHDTTMDQSTWVQAQARYSRHGDGRTERSKQSTELSPESTQWHPNSRFSRRTRPVDMQTVHMNANM